MANLAIIGHVTRGREVIELLEMLGGKNVFPYDGNDIKQCYWIDEDHFIHKSLPLSFTLFTLEEFLEKFPFKVKDKVIVLSSNKEVYITNMEWRNSEIIYETLYNDECYECFMTNELQPYKEETMEETMEDRPDLLQQLKEYFENTPREVVEKEWHEYDKYNEIGPSVEEYLEYVSNIRQPQYPKTYEECLQILDFGDFDIDITYVTREEYNLHTSFIKLKRCRDAYWKIAGKQMGLGKPWEPDWAKADERKYCIVNTEGNITKWVQKTTNKIFAFPTEEMQDAFKKNFDKDLETCKEFL